MLREGSLTYTVLGAKVRKTVSVLTMVVRPRGKASRQCAAGRWSREAMTSSLTASAVNHLCSNETDSGKETHENMLLHRRDNDLTKAYILVQLNVIGLKTKTKTRRRE